MLRRSSTTALLKTQVNLGPPLRAIDFNLNGYESEEEGIRDALISAGDQRAKTPATTKAKPTECNESENKENKVENQYSLTPFTKPNPLFSSAGYGKSTSDSTRGTPSSTFPSFLGNTAQNPKETRLGLTPSSTLPSSFPPESNAAHKHDEYPTVSQPLRVHSTHASITANHPSTPTLPPSMRHVPETWGTKAQNDSSLPLQNGFISNHLWPSAVPSHADTAQTRVTSKPPLDHSAAKRQERGQQQRSVNGHCEKPLSLNPEEKETDIVVMRSSHDEKRFKKLKLLGVGGSSKVFKVVGEDYQMYALKEVYIRHVDPAIKTAYINEIKLLNRLRDKPEIITLHDYTWNKREGVLYLLLEYAEMDFNAVIKKQSSHAHPMATALYFWNEMLQIVKVIHDEGVIHNDLKPENFVVTGAQLKLIDFGIANRIEEEKTSIQRDIRCGTINYMAPETIETYEDKDFFKVGRPSDIWSLGCILYLMVYRRTPFEHIKNKMKKWHAISNPSTPIPFPDVSSKAAVDVMQKCLRRNPKERPTINELIAHPFSRLQEMPAS